MGALSDLHQAVAAFIDLHKQLPVSAHLRTFLKVRIEVKKKSYVSSGEHSTTACLILHPMENFSLRSAFGPISSLRNDMQTFKNYRFLMCTLHERLTLYPHPAL